ncbi:MFS transporter [Paenibacillus terreus]|uniref:MFS transporter n=1 Tax=Paenibacillus terreus TaxID=1387834 RepID=A0ABV5BDW7_9BACL
MKNKPTKQRFFVLFLLFIAVAINYMDRANLSVAGSTIQNELGLSATQLGFLFSAFTWAYAAAQVPVGWLLDRIGPRMLYGWAIILWSVFTFIMAFSSHNVFASTGASFAMLVICRMLIGLTEAPAYPSNTKIVTSWFPNHERARATSIYSSAQYIGLAVFTPALAIIIAKFNWEAVFYATGFAGIVFGILWIILYRDPQESKRANVEELDYIRKNGGFEANTPAKKQKVSLSEVLYVIKQRRVWGIFIAQFAASSTLYFFLTWFMVYLEKGLHLPISKAGYAAILPYMMAMAGVLFGGFLSDYLLKKGKSTIFARKLPMVSGMILTGILAFANFFEDQPYIAVTILSFAFFANAYSNMGWVCLGDVLPKKMVGTVGGVLNLCGNLSGIISPIVIGSLVQNTGGYHGAMYYTAAVAVIGGIAFLLIVDKLEPIKLKTEEEMAPSDSTQNNLHLY